MVDFKILENLLVDLILLVLILLPEGWGRGFRGFYHLAGLLRGSIGYTYQRWFFRISTFYEVESDQIRAAGLLPDLASDRIEA